MKAAGVELFRCLSPLTLNTVFQIHGCCKQVAVSASADQYDIGNFANDSATCVAKWDRHHRSQRCFAKYRRSKGTMKPSAYRHCKEVKSPVECTR